MSSQSLGGPNARTNSGVIGQKRTVSEPSSDNGNSESSPSSLFVRPSSRIEDDSSIGNHLNNLGPGGANFADEGEQRDTWTDSEHDEELNALAEDDLQEDDNEGFSSETTAPDAATTASSRGGPDVDEDDDDELRQRDVDLEEIKTFSRDEFTEENLINGDVDLRNLIISSSYKDKIKIKSNSLTQSMPSSSHHSSFSSSPSPSTSSNSASPSCSSSSGTENSSPDGKSGSYKLDSSEKKTVIEDGREENSEVEVLGSARGDEEDVIAPADPVSQSDENERNNNFEKDNKNQTITKNKIIEDSFHPSLEIDVQDTNAVFSSDYTSVPEAFSSGEKLRRQLMAEKTESLSLRKQNKVLEERITHLEAEQEEVQLSNFKCEQILRSCIADQTTQIRAMWQHIQTSEAEADSKIETMKRQYERKENDLKSKLKRYEARGKALKTVMKDLRSYIELISSALQQDTNVQAGMEMISSKVEQLRSSIMTQGLTEIATEDEKEKDKQRRKINEQTNNNNGVSKNLLGNKHKGTRNTINNFEKIKDDENGADDEDSTTGMAHAVNEILSRWRRHSDYAHSFDDKDRHRQLILSHQRSSGVHRSSVMGSGLINMSRQSLNDSRTHASSRHACSLHASRTETANNQRKHMCKKHLDEFAGYCVGGRSVCQRCGGDKRIFEIRRHHHYQSRRMSKCRCSHHQQLMREL